MGGFHRDGHILVMGISVYLLTGAPLLAIVLQQLPYRWKFSRDEIFAKSLKTGFSRLFVCDTSITG